MSSNLDIRHLNYYEKEVTYLRQSGALFAQKYPKIAKRLVLSDKESPDPHTERLIESFAYLTSYLQKDIDDQFPRLGSTLLSVLYPQLSTQLPPMSIAEFTLDPSKGKLTTGYTIEKNFPLFTMASNAETCRFRTSYDTTLFPFDITDVTLDRADLLPFDTALSPYPFVMRIKLKTLSLPFNKYDVKNLRFFIQEESVSAHLIYQMLFLRENPIAILGEHEKTPKIMPPGSIQAVGFDMEQNVLPDFPQSNPAYRLIQEYFTFPEKFLFFDVLTPDFSDAGDTVEIIIPMCTYEKDTKKMAGLNASSLRLGCTPIINLFPKISDPIRLDHKTIEYTLTPDIRRKMTTEIHSIDKVILSNPDSPDAKEISPYFSYAHKDIMDKQQAFWMLRRTAPFGDRMPGKQSLLSFVDLEFNPKNPEGDIIYARTLCTNRDLAVMVHTGTKLQPEASVPTKSITCLMQPTPTIYPSEDGAQIWQLISQLSVNYLSMTNTTESLKALQEVLSLYTSNIEETTPININNITNMETKEIVRRVGKDAWRGFVKGISVTLTLDTDNFERHEALLFSRVLSHFFSLYTTINSFVELSIKQKGQTSTWKTWTAAVGSQKLV